jgi:5-methylcytosine-specific restriction enzyme B
MTQNLKSTGDLRAACNAILESSAWKTAQEAWIDPLVDVLERVAHATVEERATEAFQRWWWEDDTLSATGQGQVDIEPALRDASFRTWLAERSIVPLPAETSARITFLDQLYADIKEHVEVHCDRIPHIKIFRVIASLYPEASTTICHRRKLRRLSSAMGATRGMTPAARHIYILDRLREALGPEQPGTRGRAERMALPWHLFIGLPTEVDEEATEQLGARSGQAELKPLPAARRVKSLTAISGGLPLLLSTLEFAQEGASREELIDHLRGELPSYKTISLGSVVSALVSNFGILRRRGNEYLPTERGEALLESQDASDLADWLLTRVLGVDLTIVALRDQGPISFAELLSKVRVANPGWTTNYAPSGTLHWLRKLGLIDVDEEGVASLSSRGREWAGQVTWQPEMLSPEIPEITVPPIPTSTFEVTAATSLPTFDTILDSVGKAGAFPPSLVASLHAGIWADSRRHFAILTGLSGSGKTLLSRAYAQALVPKAGRADLFVKTIAVQPGWHDPGALLGYPNPLRENSYVTTPFLEFLLTASDDLGHAYTVILDEMNLSHPEQYLAPLLSAMETGDRITLHAEGDLLDEIPASIAYPSNLVLIGTVNMDETTHGLSDKILDRAFTLEFWDVDLDAYPDWGRHGLDREVEINARRVLADLSKALAPARLHFGWRVVRDVLNYLARSQALGDAVDARDALDAVVYAKILPKLRGEDSPRIRAALEECRTALGTHALTRSHRKLGELAADLSALGTARFWR